MNEFNPNQESDDNPFEEEQIVEYQYAGFWRRVAAVMIDSFLLFLIIMPFALVGGLVLGTSGFSENEVSKMSSNPLHWLSIVMYIIVALVIASFLSSKWCATPGKRLMKVFIVRTGDLSRLTFFHAFFRYSSSLVIYLFPILILFISVDAITNGVYTDHNQLLELISWTSTASEQEVENYFQQYPHIAEAFIQFALFYTIASILSVVLYIAWHLPVAFTREKTAMHDIIFGTRALVGRTNFKDE